MTRMQYSWKVSAKGFIAARQAEDSAKFHEMCFVAVRDEAFCFQSRVIMYLLLDIVETVLNITWIHPAQSHMLVYTVKLTQTAPTEGERVRQTVISPPQDVNNYSFPLKVILKLFL